MRPGLLRFFPVLCLLASRPAHADSTLVFNEVMYHPAGVEAELEWIELRSQMAVDMDISGWYLGSGVSYVFAEGTVVPGGGFLVLAASPSALAAATGLAGILGPFAGRLDNSGEALELYNQSGRLMDRVRYRDGASYEDDGDWPVAPDGSGVSLAKRAPQSASEPAKNWTASAEIGGTPGAHNFPGDDPLPGVPSGLVSYWSFDEPSGAALDPFSGNNGTLGARTSRVAGLTGSGAVSFDNTQDSFVNVGAGSSFTVTAGVTIEALIVPEWSGAAADLDLVFRKEDGPRRLLLGFQNDGNQDGNSEPPLAPGYTGPVLAFGINAGGVYRELDMPLDGQAGRPTLAALRDGSPHHVAATYDRASGLKALYVDGVLAFSHRLAAGSAVSSGGASSAYIGNMTGRGGPFTGVIDEVAFWDRGITASEVSSHFRAFEAGLGYFEETASEVRGESLAFNEVLVATAGDSWVELLNHGGAPVNLRGHTLATSAGAGADFALPERSLGPGERLVLAEAELGFPLAAGDKLFLYGGGRSAVVDAVALEDRLRGRHPEGIGRWLVPSEPTPGAANRFAFHDEVVINEILYHHRPEPAAPPVIEETVVLAIDAMWRYEASGADLGTAWRNTGFNDASWPRSRALFFNETAALPAPANTPLSLGPTTYYFRTTFTLQGEPSAANLVLRAVVDDGAVVYLNGTEVLRLNMPAGPVTAATLASPGVGDATFTGPFPLAAGPLVSGTNVIAVEVHQASAASSDVVFGAEVAATVTISEGHPFRDSPEAWIELYNRGSTSVDLSGWRFDGGIEYAFETGTALGPDAYLVVAGDSEYLRRLYPALPIAGDFSGRLSHRSDRIVLLDSAGNPADEVRYFDGGRWPEYPDGGGSSLELRDPHADNAKAEAWAASDESGRSSWRTYTYRQRAVPNFGPTRWNEFIVGLLDQGEALIDDLSVIESPGTQPVQFLQNGSFETGATSWRILGNHRHSRVIPSPGEPGNEALHLVATGATEHMHNHLETTIAGGRTAVSGRDYEVSFRARWLAGSNQLNTRLYFNIVPATTLLDVPALTGTPGARNSRFEGNIGPTYPSFGHAPVVPAAGEAVAVSAAVEDPDGVGTVTLWYSVNGGTWRSAGMTADGGLYRGTIPGQSASAIVQFYVEAEDLLGAVSTFPASGRDSRALFKVNDGQAQTGALHNFRIVMTTADADFLHLVTNVMSNELLGATVVYNESQAFYDVGVRLKGSERGRPEAGRVSFSVHFGADETFRGVHRTVALDRSGGWGIGAGPHGQDEIVLKHTATRAGSMPGMYDDMVWLISPRTAQLGPSLLMMARYGSVFLDSAFENGSDGSLYKLELIYYPTTTTDGNPQSLKPPQPDEVIGTDLRNLGTDKEAYRWTFLAENNLRRDDYSRFIELCRVLDLPAASLDGVIDDVLDVDEMLRMYALHSLCGIDDIHWFAGNHHNVMFYLRPGDQRFLAFHWDADFAFIRPPTASLWGGINLAKVLQFPRWQRLFYGHLRDIIDTAYNPTYMSYWTGHYGRLAQETSSFGTVLNYIGQRRSFVLGQLPAPVSFQVTTNGGADFTTNQQSVVIEGNAGIDAKDIVLAESEEPLALTWPTLSRWQTTVRLCGGANRLTFLAVGFDGGVVGTDLIVVTSTVGFPRPEVTSLSPAAARPGDAVAVRGRNFHDGLAVFFGDTPAAAVVFDSGRDPSLVTATVPALAAGEVELSVVNSDGCTSQGVEFTVRAAGAEFVRGDASSDGIVDISDAIRILSYLFLGATVTCQDAADPNDNEAIDLSDAVYVLNFLFRGAAAPRPPYPDPGDDPGAAGPLGCESG
jgi:hypothetical protein